MTKTMHYGPQTAEVEALLARASTLTGTEAQALGVVWDAARGAAWGAVWDAVWYAARDAARDAVWDAAWGAARYAAQDAACALVARDLITPDGFTQEHYDLLTGPWRKVIGKVHPDDKEVK